MHKTGTASQRIALVVVFALGLGLGWAGATHRAIDESRAKDSGSIAAVRNRVDEEEMRMLDLSPSQRQEFLAAREEAFQRADQVFARLRPEMELIFQQFDQRVRPILSPRQLAEYDRIEQKRRREMPNRPVGADD